MSTTVSPGPTTTATAPWTFTSPTPAATSCFATEILGRPLPPVPQDTAMGALIHHITGGAEAKTFQPMNVNFGLFPPLHDVGKKVRKEAYTNRAKEDFGEWLGAMEAVPA